MVFFEPEGKLCSLQVGHIFKELFEEDILEEEVIFEWAKKVNTEKKWKNHDSPNLMHRARVQEERVEGAGPEDP